MPLTEDDQQDPEPEPVQVKLTSADIRNGWTAESLTKYLNERSNQKAKYEVINEQRKIPKVESTLNYNPHTF